MILGLAQLGQAQLAQGNIVSLDNTITDPLSINQTFTSSKTLNPAITSTLSFGHTVDQTKDTFTSDSISLDHTVDSVKVNTILVADVIDFDHTLSAGKVKEISLLSNLSVSQVSAKTATLNPTIVQDINLKENYIPKYVSSGSGYVSGVVANIPVAIATVEQNFITMQSLSGYIVLPSPLFNDIQTNVAEVKINRAVSGVPYSYIKTSGRYQFKYSFGLKQKKAAELKTFIDDGVTDWIYLHNWKGEIWLIKIINNPVTFTADSRGWVCPGNAEYYKVDLELEGYKLT